MPSRKFTNEIVRQTRANHAYPQEVFRTRRQQCQMAGNVINRCASLHLVRRRQRKDRHSKVPGLNRSERRQTTKSSSGVLFPVRGIPPDHLSNATLNFDKIRSRPAEDFSECSQILRTRHPSNWSSRVRRRSRRRFEETFSRQ
jgi:hypothetical protein